MNLPPIIAGRTRVATRDLPTLLAVMLPLGMFFRHLSVFWSLSPQYQYGWAVPPLAACLFYRRWRTIPETDAARPSRSGERAEKLLIFFAALLAPLWLIRTAMPDWDVIGFSLASVVILIVLALLASIGGTRLAWHMAFPVLFLLCAVPWPHLMENFVLQPLVRFVAILTTGLIKPLGIAAIIPEDCGGVRAIQSTLMLSLFLGELRRLKVMQRIYVVVAGFCLVLCFNVIRNVLLALAATRFGAQHFEFRHDSAGWSILLLSFVGLLLFTRIFAGPVKIALQSAPPVPHVRLSTGIGIASWCLLILAGNELWYGLHERSVESTARLEVHWPDQSPEFHRSPISDRAQNITLCNEAESARWTDRDGRRWIVTSLHWAPGGAAPGSARSHAPDICLQASGAVAIRELPPVKLYVTGGTMCFKSRLFLLSNRPLFVFYHLSGATKRDRAGTPFKEAPSPWTGMQRVLAGQRNPGQQSVEIAIDGCTSQDEALAAIQSRLPALVSLGNPKVEIARN